MNNSRASLWKWRVFKWPPYGGRQVAGKGFCPSFARQAALQRAVNEGHWYKVIPEASCQAGSWQRPLLPEQVAGAGPGCAPSSPAVTLSSSFSSDASWQLPTWTVITAENLCKIDGGISHTREASRVMWGRMLQFPLPVGDRSLGSRPGQWCRFENPNFLLPRTPPWFCMSDTVIFSQMHEPGLLFFFFF